MSSEYNYARKVALLRLAVGDFMELERRLDELAALEVEIHGPDLKEIKGLSIQLPPLRAQLAGIHEATIIFEKIKKSPDINYFAHI